MSDDSPTPKFLQDLSTCSSQRRGFNVVFSDAVSHLGTESWLFLGAIIFKLISRWSPWVSYIYEIVLLKCPTLPDDLDDLKLWIKRRPRRIKRWFQSPKNIFVRREHLLDRFGQHLLWSALRHTIGCWCCDIEASVHDQLRKSMIKLQLVSRPLQHWARTQMYHHLYICDKRVFERFWLEARRSNLRGLSGPHAAEFDQGNRPIGELVSTFVLDVDDTMGGFQHGYVFTNMVDSTFELCMNIETAALRKCHALDMKDLRLARNLVSLSLDEVHCLDPPLDSDGRPTHRSYKLPSLRRLELRGFNVSKVPVLGISLLEFLQPLVLPNLVSLSILDSPLVTPAVLAFLAPQIRLLSVESLSCGWQCFNNLWMLNLTCSVENFYSDIQPAKFDYWPPPSPDEEEPWESFRRGTIVMPRFERLRIDSRQIWIFDTCIWRDMTHLLELGVFPTDVEQITFPSSWADTQDDTAEELEVRERVMTLWAARHIDIKFEQGDLSSTDMLNLNSDAFRTRFDTVIWNDWLRHERWIKRKAEAAAATEVTVDEGDP